MRLTLVISSLCSGGAERVMSIMANYWSRKVHNITLITLTDTADDFYPLESSIARIGLGLSGVHNNSCYWFVKVMMAVARLRREIKNTQPDLVISFMYRMNIVTLVSTLRLNIPVVISERTDPLAHKSGWVWNILREIFYGYSNALVVQTKSVGHWARLKWPNLPIYTIPNPVVSNKEKTNAGSNHSNCIVAIGSLEKHKGYDLLVEAFFKAVNSVHDRWELLILGEGSQRKYLKKMILTLGIDDCVKMPGRTKNIQTYLQQASIFVLASRYEGFPNSLLEAMMSGLPVISTDCPSGPGEIIQHGVDGILVPPEDVSALSEAMFKLMSDETLRGRLGSKAKVSVERYNVENVMNQWDDLLDKFGTMPLAK